VRNPKIIRTIVAIVLVFLVPAIFMTCTAAGQESDVPGFPTLAMRSVEIWSDGTRLAGNLFYPKDRKEGEKLPAIVLCHGWGGTKEHLNRAYAPQFAEEGYFVLSFDYRGWGESDSRLVVASKMPAPDENGEVTVTAQAIRELVDPFDQQDDIDAAISFIEGEPGVDRNRIGLWGTSFGGGHVVWRAAHDDRVKCITAQVGAMDQRIGVERALKPVFARFLKAAGPATDAEAEKLRDEIYERMRARAGEIEDLSRAGKIAESLFTGMLVVSRDGRDDERAKALVQQENDDRKALFPIIAKKGEILEPIYQRRISRARGIIDPVPQGVDPVPGLRGTPYLDRFIQFVPADYTDKVTCPVLIIDVEKEELFDTSTQGHRVYKQLKGRVPVKYELFEGITHYDIYRGEPLQRSRQLQIDWYNEHLKGQG
jgi:dienelactone hydrolase